MGAFTVCLLRPSVQSAAKFSLSLPRHPNHVLVGRELTRVESLDGFRHRRQKLDEAAAVLPRLSVAESEVGTADEHAGRIQRKRRDIRQEMPPVVTLLKKILL